MSLTEVIIERIRREGPVSFRDFMEMCLYHPGSGYYTSAQDKIGKQGDFYTSSSVTPVFGAMIGKQLEEMWSVTGEKDFTVVEFGAGTGRLCGDILDYLKNNPRLYGRLTYCIIEKSPAMRAKAKTHLPEEVKWYDSIKEIPSFTGCVLSNELVDNFSVHQVVMKDQLMEIFVDYNDGFVERLEPAAASLSDYLREMNVVLPAGFRTEINLEATQWIKDISQQLDKGYVMTIDYGYTSEEMYRESRNNGTLLCYHKHSINDQPYDNLGEQDITSHVNFSALSHWGEKNGLTTCGLTRLNRFLLALGWDDHLRKTITSGPDQYLALRQYASIKYHFLVDMGQKFSVLIQCKGIDSKNLQGLNV
jgi:SAM-dependent MidA family methyltransferase